MEQKEKISGKELKKIVFSEIAKLGKVLSDATRIEIIELLSQSERNVDDLASLLGLEKAITSHHLQVLKSGNLVSLRKDGRYSYYRATPLACQLWQLFSERSTEISAEITLAMNNFFIDGTEIAVLDYADLKSKAEKEEIILIDVRPEKEFLSGHFPGAVSIPLKELDGKIKKLPKNKKIIAYCRGPYCVLSENAVLKLRENNRQAFRWKEGVTSWSDTFLEKTDNLLH